MATVLTEFLTQKDRQTKEKIAESADFIISDFKEILNIVKK